MPEITLHLVRHGETPDNAIRRFQTPNAPLSDRGREQAAAVAAELAASMKAEVLLASDYARTMETATIIGAAVGLPVTREPALRERNYGVARGQMYADVGAEAMAGWRDPFVRIPEGESWADVFDRVAALFDRLRADPPAPEMLLVTHGGSMSVALALLDGLAVADFQVQPLENCAWRTVKLATGAR